MNGFSFSPFPVFQTERLYLRQPCAGDAAKMLLLRTDASVNAFIDRAPSRSEQEMLELIQKLNRGIENNESAYWIISQPPSEDLIGTICLWQYEPESCSAEIGFELLPGFQGKGIMQEALQGVLEFAFGVIGLKKIEAYTDRRNEASLRLLRRNGFILVRAFEEQRTYGKGTYTMSVLERINPVLEAEK
ncbi:MAG: GNAT family N-acetyltransferase [Saprospiraceae bacterium]